MASVTAPKGIDIRRKAAAGLHRRRSALLAPVLKAGGLDKPSKRAISHLRSSETRAPLQRDENAVSPVFVPIADETYIYETYIYETYMHCVSNITVVENDGLNSLSGVRRLKFRRAFP